MKRVLYEDIVTVDITVIRSVDLQQEVKKVILNVLRIEGTL